MNSFYLLTFTLFASTCGQYLSSFDYGSIASQYLPTSLEQGSGLVQSKDQCDLYKVAFKQDLYFQYVQYKAQLPELKEFTLCMWHKFTNHSNDHPLFSYAGKFYDYLYWLTRNHFSNRRLTRAMQPNKLL